MSFAFLIVALTVAAFGQVSNAQGCGIGIGEDICRHRRPLHIPRLPIVVRPVELPRPVIELTTPKPAAVAAAAASALSSLPSIPVPPLLPLGGPCSCKRTLVKPAIVPKPVCQYQRCNKASTCCNTCTCNQKIVTNQCNTCNTCNGQCNGQCNGNCNGQCNTQCNGQVVLNNGFNSGYSDIVSGVSGISGVSGVSGFSGVSGVTGLVEGVNTLVRGVDSIGGGYSGSVGTVDSLIDESSSGGATTYLENEYARDYVGSSVDSMGGGAYMESHGPGRIVETIVDGPYVDTIVGGRRCVNVPYGSEDQGVAPRKNPHAVPADAVSMTIAYNLAKKACEQSEDKLFFGFRQMPKELPRRVISRRYIGNRVIGSNVPEEGNLYQLNGEVVELKAPSKMTTPKSLAEEAAEDLLDLVADEQEQQGLDYTLPVRKVTLGEIGYGLAKKQNPLFVDVPAAVSDAVDSVVETIGDALGGGGGSGSGGICQDGFRAGNVAVMPVPKIEPMLSRPKLETLLEPCSSEERYAPVAPYSVQYTACNSKSSSSSSAGSLISKIVAKLG